MTKKIEKCNHTNEIIQISPRTKSYIHFSITECPLSRNGLFVTEIQQSNQNCLDVFYETL